MAQPARMHQTVISQHQQNITGARTVVQGSLSRHIIHTAIMINESKYLIYRLICKLITTRRALYVELLLVDHTTVLLYTTTRRVYRERYTPGVSRLKRLDTKLSDDGNEQTVSPSTPRAFCIVETIPGSHGNT